VGKGEKSGESSIREHIIPGCCEHIIPKIGINCPFAMEYAYLMLMKEQGLGIREGV